MDKKHVTQISCGAYHTGALIVDGSEILFGKNNYGQTEKVITNFITDDIVVEQISCGENHTALR